MCDVIGCTDGSIPYSVFLSETRQLSGRHIAAICRRRGDRGRFFICYSVQKIARGRRVARDRRYVNTA